MTAASPLTFRPAGLSDVDAVVALVESAYRGDSSRLGWTTEADLLDGQRTDTEEVGRLLHREGSAVILAETDRGLIGCFHLQRHSGERAYFGMFAVSPRYQGLGTGKALLFEARRMAAAWGCRTIRMTVLRQRSDLIGWYARRGFRATGETAAFPYGDERFGRPRRDDLEFVVLEGSTELQSPMSGPGRA